MISVAGVEYDITVRAISRNWIFDWKYREPTEDGTMHGEIRGVYYRYKIVFNAYTDYDEYALLVDALTRATEFQEIIVPSEQGDITFTAWLDNVGDEIWIARDGKSYFNALTVTFTSQSPQRTP